MGFLGVSLFFVGYLLCYAAAANGGKFATSPLDALKADAYDT